MDEDRRAEPLRRGEEREELRRREVPGVHVGADLHAGEAKLLHTALEFPDRELGGLQRNGPKPHTAARVRRDEPGEVVVQVLRKLEPMFAFCPVAKHGGHGAEDLDADPFPVTIREPHLRVETIGSDGPEDLAVVANHPHATLLGGLEPDEASVAKALLPTWEPAGKHVGVDVDFQRRRRHAFTIRWPQRLQVQCSAFP